MDPKPPLAGELGTCGTGFPVIMPSPFQKALVAPVAPRVAAAGGQPLRLSLYATIAPLLPLSECAIPGRFEAVIEEIQAAGVYAGIEAQVSQILLIGAHFFCVAGLGRQWPRYRVGNGRGIG